MQKLLLILILLLGIVACYVKHTDTAPAKKGLASKKLHAIEVVEIADLEHY